jgi:hypothetical protein
MNDKRTRIILALQVLSLVVTILATAIFIHYIFEYNTTKNNVFMNKSSIDRIEKRLSEVESKPVPAVIHGINGKDGRDGKDSKSTHTVNKETIIKEVPVKGADGKTMYIQCNKERNRWEFRTNPDELWMVLGEATPCTITKEILLELLGE